MLTQPLQLLVDPLLTVGHHQALDKSSIGELCSSQEGVPVCCHLKTSWWCNHYVQVFSTGKPGCLCETTWSCQAIFPQCFNLISATLAQPE